MSTGKNDPINPIGEGALAIGLTKREYFAAFAMQGMLANSFNDNHKMPFSYADHAQIAYMAVSQTDQLIEELNKEVS